ncbi:signal peptide-containing protein [Aspergillus terreus]|uniref:Signal peptide-containing protein n=1 Tax=Aspergillus terreus TaxID=33178 RepID=A0A5M3Z7D4_ASPTE|nr:hypothetical protein ATETN484_0010027500 [Aspergillus terreus]GFF18322.1 signal peptide-containing protein [Aspergillus terreus]
MRSFTVSILALLATSAVAMPEASPNMLEARVDCKQIHPACNGGRVVGQTNCRCSGQRERCDLWSCPGGPPNVMVCGQAGTGCVWI